MGFSELHKRFGHTPKMLRAWHFPKYDNGHVHFLPNQTHQKSSCATEGGWEVGKTPPFFQHRQLAILVILPDVKDKTPSLASRSFSWLPTGYVICPPFHLYVFSSSSNQRHCPPQNYKEADKCLLDTHGWFQSGLLTVPPRVFPIPPSLMILPEIYICMYI